MTSHSAVSSSPAARRLPAVADVVRGIYDGLSDTSFQIQIGNTHYSGM